MGLVFFQFSYNGKNQLLWVIVGMGHTSEKSVHMLYKQVIIDLSKSFSLHLKMFVFFSCKKNIVV